MRNLLRVTKRLGVLTIFIAVSSAALGCSASSNGIPARPDKLSGERLEFAIPQVDRWKLANGLTVVYYYNDELPQVKGKLYFPGGALNDPSEIAGLSAATGDQIREGSVPGITPDDLDKHLDALAASIESGFSDEYGTVGFFSLAEDFDEVFSLFEKVVRTPAFSTSRLTLWKKLAAEGIRRRRDDPGTMAGMTFNRLLFGENNAYTRALSYESLAKITPQKMREFYQQFVRPDGAYLAVSGAIPKERMMAAIEQHFGSWQPGTATRPAMPGVTYTIKPGVYVLNREFDQATVFIGHRGPARHTPDQYAISIYNRVFGHGSFGSTLFKEIRTRLGLAYSVSGGITTGPVVGSFQIDMGTRATEATNAILKSIELAADTRNKLPPEQEFNDAKSAVERSFVFKFSDPGYLVDRAVILDLLGYPAGYDANYLSQMEKVTRDDVKAVATQWVHPEELVTVIVGRITPEQVKKAVGDKADVYRVTFDLEPKIGELVQ